MFWRRWSWVGTGLGAFLWAAALPGQQNPVTADQVVAKYLEAIGASRFPAITTFIQKAELSGNVTSFYPGVHDPSQSQIKEHATFEFYFKAPNLRFSLSLAENNVAFDTHGCDGKVAWYIGPDGRRTELKPTPGNLGDCKEGYEPMPLRVRAPNVRLRLEGQHRVGDRMAWEVAVDDPKSPSAEIYYFDAETYLLLRYEILRSDETVMYSDYRDVGGIKVPFKTTRQLENSFLVSTVREMKIDVPLDDASFAEPNPKPEGSAVIPLRATREDGVNILPSGPPEAPAAASAPSLPEVKIPNFVSCAIAELQQTVPELRGLKTPRGQEELSAILSKVGAKTADLARKTPDLISHEAVVEFQTGAYATRRDFNYLVLAHSMGRDTVAFDEFRMDRKSGDKFQTDETQNPPKSPTSPPSLAGLQPARQLPMPPERPPLTQGFANMWVYFYPLNQPESDFRYLGRQKMNRHDTLVVAFAQKPGWVRLPAEFHFAGKSVPIFFQGVAWIDRSDFKIVRLRTDLLLPAPNVDLRRLTADIQFGEIRIAQLALPLWLPREVAVTSDIGGVVLRDRHKYSDYRLYRAQGRIVLDR